MRGVNSPFHRRSVLGVAYKILHVQFMASIITTTRRNAAVLSVQGATRDEFLELGRADG
jgi:hypothetical protein